MKAKLLKLRWMKMTTIVMLLIFSLVGCVSSQADENVASSTIQTEVTATSTDASSTNIAATASTGTTTTDTTATTSSNTTITDSANSNNDNVAIPLSTVESSMLATAELFSERDLEQSPDLTNAVFVELKSDEDFIITQEGVYILNGEVTNATIIVDAPDDAKVQVVLDGVSITNEASPAIYVKSADKVFVTTTDSENYLEVSGTYVAEEDVQVDAAIFSKADLVLNGVGSLEILSMEGNGITSKDDLKVTGGTFSIKAYADALEANDAILIYDGEIDIVANADGLHSENNDDTSLGYIYIHNGTLTISAGDDAIHANSIVQIDGGIITIETCREGIEGTYIQINGGEIDITAKDDGINAAAKSDYDVVIELNDGLIHIVMGSGDTDAVDSNGDIYVNGGTIDIEATSAFDSDGTAELNGGDVTVNGSKISEIIQRQMGGGKRR